MAYAPPPPKKKTSPWVVIAIIVGSIFGLLAIVVGGGALFVLTAEESPPSDAERALLLDASAVMYGGREVNPAHETAVKTSYWDGSYDIAYRHEDPAGESLFVEHSLTFERKHSDTLTSYTALWASTKVTLAATDDIEIVEPEGGFSWGDASHFANLMNGSDVVGHLFVARKGKAVVYLLIAGWYYEDLELFGALVQPTLDALEKHAVGL